MTLRTILTVDVGTSSTKTALWNEAGELLAEATASYPLSRPKALWAEIDAEVWWQAVISSVQATLAQSTVDPASIAGIGVDGIGGTLIPVDENVRPLGPAIIWLDRRSTDEAAWLNSLPSAQRLVELDANPIDPAYVTPKLVWLQRNQPDVFANTHKFLGATGFIVARFTDELTCDWTQASGYHFFDIRNERWDADAAESIGISLERMPELHAPTDVVGAVTTKAAAETGLRVGTPVLAGCLDAIAGALGSGVTQPGQTNEQGGQAGGLGIGLDRIVVEPRLIFSHHVLPGQYVLAAGTVGGGSLGWFRDHFGQAEEVASTLVEATPFELFSQQAAQSPVGSNGLIFLPYMAGERTPLWSTEARGVFFGLSYSHTRADMIRAIMEGCAFAVYDNVQIAAEHGVEITEYLGSGGAVNSSVWCQIKADVYGSPFVVAERSDGGGEGGHGLGLFAMTASAVGLRDDIGDCINTLLPSRRVFEPSAENHEYYQQLFRVYRSVSRKLLPDFADLDKLRRQQE